MKQFQNMEKFLSFLTSEERKPQIWKFDDQ